MDKIKISKEDYEECLKFILKLRYLWGGATIDFASSGVKRDVGKYSRLTDFAQNYFYALSEFKNENIIGFEGKEITIKNLARLKKISEVG